MSSASRWALATLPRTLDRAADGLSTRIVTQRTGDLPYGVQAARYAGVPQESSSGTGEPTSLQVGGAIPQEQEFTHRMMVFTPSG